MKASFPISLNQFLAAGQVVLVAGGAGLLRQ